MKYQRVELPEVRSEPLFKNFVQKIIGFEHWVLENRRKLEKRLQDKQKQHATTNN